MALSASAGAVGLATGILDLGEAINRRLPFDSPVIAGVALAALVALPTAMVAWLASRGDRRTETAALVAGVIMIGWIVVQLAFIRQFSFLQPVTVGAGAALALIGSTPGEGRARRPTRPSSSAEPMASP